MYLSPYTQYLLRRLLQHPAQTTASNLATPSVRIDANIDLNQLLCKLYPRKFVAISKANQIEQLVRLYQQFSAQSLVDPELQDELRNRIFHILGLHLEDKSVNLPPLVPEGETHGFRFFYADQIREGLYIEDKLYGLLLTTESFDRLSLYQLAWLLSEQKIACVLTYSPIRQALWVPVRSPVYQVFVQQGRYPLEKVLTLYRLLHRFDRPIASEKDQSIDRGELVATES